MTVSELVTELGKTNKLARESYKAYKQFKQQEDFLRSELVAKLKDSGLKSAKTDNYMASLSTRKDIQVVNEAEAVNWIYENDLDAEHLIGLRTSNFKTLAKAKLKDTGEVVPGAEVVETESLSIRANK